MATDRNSWLRNRFDCMWVTIPEKNWKSKRFNSIIQSEFTCLLQQTDRVEKEENLLIGLRPKVMKKLESFLCKLTHDYIYNAEATSLSLSVLKGPNVHR